MINALGMTHEKLLNLLSTQDGPSINEVAISHTLERISTSGRLLDLAAILNMANRRHFVHGCGRDGVCESE